MSKRKDPKYLVAIIVWVNRESEIGLVATEGYMCQQAFALTLGHVGGPGCSSEEARTQAFDSGRFGLRSGSLCAPKLQLQNGDKGAHVKRLHGR